MLPYIEGMPERPFSDYEMKVLRGVIDDQVANRVRRQRLWHRLSTFERLLLVGATVWGAVVPTVALLIALLHHH